MPIQIEIWSDIVCPFCYIGKRHLEMALEQFKKRDRVQLHWKSFELNPDRKTDSTVNIYQLLARKYNQTVEWAQEMTQQTVNMAERVGLVFHYDKIIPANSFDAHRLIHLAERHGLQKEAKERLMAAYFTEGKNISDMGTLKSIGVSLGLDANQVHQMLDSDLFTTEVRRDEREAANLGIRGVPFFLFNGKMAISGAQPTDAFLAALQSF